jgi:hypothetical protein
MTISHSLAAHPFVRPGRVSAHRPAPDACMQCGAREAAHTTPPLDDGQREVLAQALGDAIEYRTPEGFCADCEMRPEGLCNDHAADLDLTDAYIALSRELGLEIER